MRPQKGPYGRLNSNHQELYDLIREDDWRAIIKWITTSPMMITVITKAPKEIMKEPLLHILIEYDKTELVIEVILELLLEKQALESDGEKDEQTLESERKKINDILEAKNFNDDTALHVAAAKGNKAVALALLEACSTEILNMRNKDGEIPIHRAALNGWSEMFDLEQVRRGSNYKARRSDGATILHCAIMAYHFELAGKIIETTPELIFARDQLGLTPLHHMVSIPDAFRHGCDLGMLDSLLYKCVAVEKSLTRPLKKKRSNEESLVSSPDIDSEVLENPNEDHMHDDQPDVEEKNLRNTYGQWVRQLVNNISASIRRKKKGKDPQSDPEAGEDDHHHSFIRHHSELSHYQHSKKHKLFESNFVDDETGGNSNVFSKILLKPSVKWIQKQVYNFMRQTNYWNDLIELKKKHESANNLLTSIAMNQEYWWTLSFGSIPQSRLVSQQKHDKVMERWMETPLTLAATMGLDELVIRILEKHPAAATYRGKEGKNLLHIAVENRQEIIVDMLSWIGREDPRLPLRLKSAKDDNGNTILHLAAMCNNQPGSPLQMSKEFKWFEQVKKILPKDLVNHRNKDGKTAKELFTETHTKMVEDAKAQLTNTASTCCSAMVTAVTFSAGFSIANDNDKKEKIADHRNRVVLKMFSHTYMFGLSCTAVALVQFMALLMASYKEEDFRRSLPTQYKVALATLFTAMMAMVLAFACNTYNSLYNELNPNWKNYLYVAIEVLIVPLICFIALRCGGVKCRIRKI